MSAETEGAIIIDKETENAPGSSPAGNNASVAIVRGGQTPASRRFGASLTDATALVAQMTQCRRTARARADEPNHRCGRRGR